jgi:plasmid replication initiation protein
MAKAKRPEQGKNELIVNRNLGKVIGNLSSLQHRGMNAILKRSWDIMYKDDSIKYFKIPIDTLLKDMQLDYNRGRNEKIKDLKSSLMSLTDIKFNWGDKKDVNVSVFIQQFYTEDDNAVILYGDYVRKKLGEITNFLVVDDFVTLQSFKSVYAQRLFKHLQSWKRFKTLTLKLQDFKDFMGISDIKAYNRMTDLKTKVLSVAIKEINDKSDYKVSYENIKDGRSIVAFKFDWFYVDPNKNEKITKEKNERALKNSVGKYIYSNDTMYKILDYKMYEYGSPFIGYIRVTDTNGKEKGLDVQNIIKLKEKIELAKTYGIEKEEL